MSKEKYSLSLRPIKYEKLDKLDITKQKIR